MCGIVGYSGKPSSEARTQFIRLCDEARIRGEHAYGIAYYDEAKGVVFAKGTDFGTVMQLIPDTLPTRIIFHARYSTSGDYHDMLNNQPIVIDGDALVFNGTVDMGTKTEMEQRNGLTMHTDNDGELVLRDIQGGDLFRRLRDNLVTFAGIVLRGNGEMFALRNAMRPLWRFDVPGGTFLASTYDIALRAKLEAISSSPIKPMEVVRL